MIRTATRIVNDDNWECIGAVACNLTDHIVPLIVEMIKNGLTTRLYSTEIEPRREKVFYKPDCDYLAFVHGEEILTTGMQTDKRNNSNTALPLAAVPIEYNRPYLKERKTIMRSSEIIRFGGRCDIINLDIWYFLNLIAMEIYYLFPDRKSRYLAMGDCSDNPCVGHPTGTHNDGRDFDFCYYTYGESNFTQKYYTPEDYPFTDLWLRGTGKVGTEQGLLKDVFDWERNAYFIEALKKYFPYAQVIIQDDLCNRIMRMRGSEFRQLVNTDQGTKYNHHEHGHVGISR